MSRSCFLPIFVWTSADNSLGIFQTAQSLLRDFSKQARVEGQKESKETTTGEDS